MYDRTAALARSRSRTGRAPLVVAAALGLGLLAGGSALAAPAQAATLTGTASSDEFRVMLAAQQAMSGTTLSVTGTGTVSVEPDVAQLSFSVNATETTAAAATETANTTAEAVNAALVAAGIDEADIQTSGVSLYPRYSWSDETGESTITGYQASVSYEVSGVALDEVGAVLGSAIDAGVSQIDSIAYYSSDYDAQYQQALTLAVEQARGKAEALAGSMFSGGEESLFFTSVTEAASSRQYRYADASAYNSTAGEAEASTDMGMDVSASIKPGTIDIEAEVTVVYTVYDVEGALEAYGVAAQS